MIAMVNSVGSVAAYYSLRALSNAISHFALSETLMLATRSNYCRHHQKSLKEKAFQSRHDYIKLNGPRVDCWCLQGR